MSAIVATSSEVASTSRSRTDNGFGPSVERVDRQRRIHDAPAGRDPPDRLGELARRRVLQ